MHQNYLYLHFTSDLPTSATCQHTDSSLHSVVRGNSVETYLERTASSSFAD